LGRLNSPHVEKSFGVYFPLPSVDVLAGISGEVAEALSKFDSIIFPSFFCVQNIPGTRTSRIRMVNRRLRDRAKKSCVVGAGRWSKTGF
jgi:hypothetical protein